MDERSKYGNVPVALEFDLGRPIIHFRSKLEARYANYLERLREVGTIMGWWYEPPTGKLRFPECLPAEWLPDFYVLTSDWNLEIHETKGLISQKDIHKFRRAIEIEVAANISKIVLIFARESKKQPQLKARAAQWVEIRYADVLFKQVFGSSKAGVL